MNKKKELIKTSGFTVVEILLAAFILMIVMLGAGRFSLQTVQGAMMADHETDASQVALLFCETWCGLDGSTSFDPIATFQDDMTIATVESGPALPSGFTRLGRYEILYNGISYWVNLAWRDEADSLRSLNIVVSWNRKATGQYQYLNTDKSYKLTTYVLTD